MPYRSNRTVSARRAVANATSPNEVLIVSSNLGQVGVINQAAGVARVARPQATLHFVKVRIKRKNISESLLRAMVRSGALKIFRRRLLWARILGVLIHSEFPLTRRAELVVTTAHGDSMLVGELLAELWGVPLISSHPEKHTTNITLAVLQRSRVLSQKVLRQSNAVILDTTASPFTNTEAAQLGSELIQTLEAPQRSIWSFHFGGNCNGYSYSLGFDGALEFMERCAEDLGVSWLISTSRRTGGASEAYLRDSLTGRSWFLGGAWFSSLPALEYPAVVGASEVCVVTEESISMISDSVNALRPVLLWSGTPKEHLDFRNKNVHRVEAFVRNLEARGWCRKLSTSEQMDPSSIQLPRVQDDLADHWETRIRERLQDLGVS